jgi:hypothetical protein
MRISAAVKGPTRNAPSIEVMPKTISVTPNA